MEAKTIVITGASDGIGATAAQILVKMGHRVILVGRNPEKTKTVAKALDCPYHVADFSKLQDVVRLAEELKAYPRIDVLANNAGGLQNIRRLTEDGIESTFQINVLAPFLLTELLAKELCRNRATVIQTASIAADLFGQKLDLTDFQNERGYTPSKAYGEAKLCDILFTRELNRRYADKGISAVAFEPWIPRTNFASEAPAFFRIAYHSVLKYLFTSSTQSAAMRLVRLAVGTPNEDFTPGETYHHKRPYRIHFKDPNGVTAKALWEACERLTKPYLHP